MENDKELTTIKVTKKLKRELKKLVALKEKKNYTELIESYIK